MLTAAMGLFGRQGYVGTSVSQIEAAAGLSPGSGALFRHFSSKRALLEAGIDRAVSTGAELSSLLGDATALAGLPLEERLLIVARAGLARLEQQQDLNRLVLRDLTRFPDLLERVRDREIGRTFEGFSLWLRHQPEASDGADWDAVAMVLMGAVTHYWIMVDTFGSHPSGLDAERYLGAAAGLAAALVRSGATP
ncbi:TetR/AcrR family transcriptional regulator [Modestobacter altitudinis]|uniref:TetR/AcrR family transcriptional regulator n=1 Tax=Modestobacter altitudinis TaxID=2213158 RepID=UPI0014876050|nr:TetR/AcrR family transcriptional regulator [Modestobacter altitudinis]